MVSPALGSVRSCCLLHSLPSWEGSVLQYLWLSCSWEVGEKTRLRCVHQSDFSWCCALRIDQKDSAHETPVRSVLGLRMLTAVTIRFGGGKGKEGTRKPQPCVSASEPTAVARSKNVVVSLRCSCFSILKSHKGRADNHRSDNP